MAKFEPQAELPVSEQAQIRRDKLAALQAEGRDPFLQTKFHFDSYAADIKADYEKYEGKTVSFKGQVAMLRRTKDGMFAPGRFVMTCCVEDIQFCGIPCRYEGSRSLESRSWVMVTAKINAEMHQLYKGDIGPVLTAVSVEQSAAPAEPDVATF